MKIRFLFTSLILGLSLSLWGCNGVETTGNDNLQNQVNRTMSENQQIRSQLANLQAEVTDLQSELRTINGRLEELAYGTQRGVLGGSAELNAYSGRVAGMDARVDAIEAFLADAVAVKQDKEPFKPAAVTTAPAITTGVTAPVATTAAFGGDVTLSIGEPDLPEDQFYAKAKNTFDAGNYDEARMLFDDFLKFFPNSKIADSAVFWIGETYYRQENYERAILEYQRAMDTYPNGNKIPSCIYKQGLAFIALGDTVNGKILLEDLVARYPDSSEARVAANRLKNM